VIAQLHEIALRMSRRHNIPYKRAFCEACKTACRVAPVGMGDFG
jgi:hypothetical protein